MEDGDVSLSPSVNKLLALALPMVPPHTNILRNDASQLLMDGSTTIISHISSSF